MKMKIAYLVSHPIQYQVPLLRKIAKDPSLDLKVFFCSDHSVRRHFDSGFNREVSWDMSLLEGYDHQFLPSFGNCNDVTFWRPWNYGLWRALKSDKFDYLWIHGYSRFINWQAFLIAKILGIKVLIRDEAHAISSNRTLLKKILKRVFFYFLNKLTDSFLSIGSMNSKYYLDHGVSNNKIFLVPYAVDNDYYSTKASFFQKERITLKKKLGLDVNRPIILFASKLSQRKRPFDLLEAYIECLTKLEIKPYLLFVGDGLLGEKIKSKVKKLKLENNVFLLGFQGLRELPAYYDLCDVFVLPSSNEPWGLVVNEAMNAQKAIIVSNEVGCGYDLVKHGENGYIFNVGDIKNLQEVLIKSLADPSETLRMGKKSFDIIKKWNFDKGIIGIHKVFQRDY